MTFTSWDELRELVWLASVVTALSVLSVGIAVAIGSLTIGL